jgi:8-oxo-dGTP pyrophosphatase MutT (NUDIX family)
MPMSNHLAAVRAKVGHDVLTLAGAAVAIFYNHERLLLVQDTETGLWELPGGAVDPDELPSDAAVRECWEETGLLVQTTRLIGVFGGPEFRIKYPNGDITCYTTITFEVRIVGGAHRPDGAETASLRYFTKAECDHPSVTPSSRIMASRAFLADEFPHFAPATWSPRQAD